MADREETVLRDARHEQWLLANPFVISRGAKTTAQVVVVELKDGRHVGRGESVPYARYGETVESVIAQITSYAGPLERTALQAALPAGAARNAVDCALWDLECKKLRREGQPPITSHLAPVQTAFTISLGAPEEMAKAALEAERYGLLKLKLGGDGDDARMRAVREVRPDARLIGDANEAWDASNIEYLLSVAQDVGVELIEQPLPADHDAILKDIVHPITICADESARTSREMTGLTDRYAAVNIKLDKAGGLTEALKLKETAQAAGLRIMIGSMVGTSLGVAPALCLAEGADWVDLDGPLLLAIDRKEGLQIVDGMMSPPTPALWG